MIDKKIKDLSKNRGISIRQLCLKIGMTENGLSSSLKNNTLKIDTLQKISEVLEVPITTFFVNTDHEENFWIPIEDEVEEKLKSIDNKVNGLSGQMAELNGKLDKLIKLVNKKG